MPIECRASATIPPIGPGPYATTKMAARISSGTARESVMMLRHIKRMIGCVVVFAAAPIANG